MNKKRVLCWFDAPSTSTGFAQVSKNVLKHLYATGEYAFDIIGINHDGSPYDTEKFPYRIFPAVAPLSSNEKMRSDVYGFQKFLIFAGSGNYDLIYIINDTFIINVIMPQLLEVQKKMPKEKRFEIIVYYPVDSPLKPEWVKNVIAPVSFPVAYTKYAFEETIKHDESLAKKLSIIYHGVEKKTFFPYPKEEVTKIKREVLGKNHCDKFMVLNVGRNQPRKDMHKTFAGFKIFHDKYPNTILFILAQAEDVGGNLVEIAKHYGLEWDKDWICPTPGSYGANQGYPIEVVNKIYSAADVVVSTNLGEGFGLSTVESMAVKRPILITDNTATHEIIGENQERGWFIKCGDTPSNWVCLGAGDNNQVRPSANVEHMAEMLEYIYTHPEEAQAKTDRAFAEVWTWDEVCKKWVDLFAKAGKKVDIMRANHPEMGRNDPCLCGSGKKWKECCM